MLVQLPRLTSSLRQPFDVDQAAKPHQSSSSVDESELTRKIVHRWEEASYELRQAYKQFIGAVVELIDGEVQSEEFRQVALAVYRLFGRPEEEGSSVGTNFSAKKKFRCFHFKDVDKKFPSRRQTRLTALDLIQYAASDEHPRQFLSIPEEELQMVLYQVTDTNLRHTLQFGIGLHHAGLNDKDTSLVEELFANNKIQVLVCTSTLAWGVNLPAHLVIIKMFNPAYYGLESSDTEVLSSYMSRLVQNTLEDLEDSGCIKMSDDSLEPTIYLTVSMFGSNIGSDTSLEVFLHILSAASEYDELPVRHNEENYNGALSERVRYKVDEDRLDDPHVKANLLFQAHFSQLELPISDYVTDLKSVFDQSIRIMQAMIEICANSGWLSSSLTCMHLLQMVMHLLQMVMHVCLLAVTVQTSVYENKQGHGWMRIFLFIIV